MKIKDINKIKKIDLTNFGDLTDEQEKEIIEYIKANPDEIYIDYYDIDNSRTNVCEYNTQEAFIDSLYDSYIDSTDEYNDNMVNTIFEKFKDKINVKNELVQEKVRDLVLDYHVTNLNIDEFLDNDFKFNIIFQFGNDANTDFTGNDWLKFLMSSQRYLIRDYPLIEKYSHYQQPLDIEESKFMDEIKTKSNNSKFITSLGQEIANMYYDTLRTLACTCKLTVRDYYKIKEGKFKQFTLKTNVGAFGLFNPIHGCGSVLELELEKDIIIKKKNIFNIYLDEPNVRCNKTYYSIDDTYGLSSECFVNCIENIIEEKKESE